MVVQEQDGIEYALQEPFDFSLLNKFGRVFRVFDKQDSGCICFGVQRGNTRRFVKFAGAKPMAFRGECKDAVLQLKYAASVYETLRHEHLVDFLHGEDVGQGYCAVFNWTDAECMGKQYQSRDKFFELPIDKRLGLFEDILAFHEHVAALGYVAIDFYDGSIMYDFRTGKTTICDIDFYAKMPYINNMGRMWGSARFMSPEEFTKGAQIDQVSNVYLMGATAFALLGDPYDRVFSTWTASDAQYHVAKKAVNEDRNERYQSIEEFWASWSAVGT